MDKMIYRIEFEENLDLDDVDFYLKDIESPIRLEIGDKIVLSAASFDSPIEYNKVERMAELLLEKSIHASEYMASFEISDITYHHGHYEYDEINFHGIITLKGK